GWSALYMFALHQLGGTAISQDGRQITLNSDEGIGAMRIIKRLWDAGGLDVDWWSAAYWGALREGQLVGDFAPAWVRGFWEAQLSEASGAQGAGQWRIAKLPGGDGVQYRTGVWISSQLVSPQCGVNQEGAVAFMQYALASVAGAARCGQWGIMPAYRPYLASPDCLNLRSPLFGDWPFAAFWAEQEQELSPTFYRPAGWRAVDAVVGKEMVPILRDEVSLEEGIGRIVALATPDFERTRCQ
ncbi:MAG: hypothetical protein M3Q45_13990, partial [Chloroflexota bacterium]|nr:hypothetical protein [Chloroflexota bacterium]